MDIPLDSETRERLEKIARGALAIVAISVVIFTSIPAHAGVMDDLRAKEASRSERQKEAQPPEGMRIVPVGEQGAPEQGAAVGMRIVPLGEDTSAPPPEGLRGVPLSIKEADEALAKLEGRFVSDYSKRKTERELETARHQNEAAAKELEAAQESKNAATLNLLAAVVLASVIPVVALIVLSRYDPSTPRLRAIAVWVAVSVLCLMALFPPWYAVYEYGRGPRRTLPLGYCAVWRPPEISEPIAGHPAVVWSVRINFPRLSLQAAPVLLIAGTLLLARKNGGKGSDT